MCYVDYLNIHIDGTAFGANVESKSRPEDLAASGAFSGVPGAPSSTDTTQRVADLLAERRRAATKRYEEAVFRVLVAISHQRSGRAVIAEVRRSGKQVTIVPYLPSDQDWENASARPVNVEDATRKHRRPRDSDGDPIEEVRRGTGRGSDSEIQFIPKDLATSINSHTAVKVKSAWTPGHDPYSLAFEDELLLHELVHSFRQAAGQSNRRRVPRQPRYDTMEELVAITVTNVYRSECHRPGVRNDNHGKLELMFCSGEHFLKLQFNRIHLWKFCRQHPILARDLGSINTYFNPFQHLRAAN